MARRTLNAVSLGGDADTMACIAGGNAEAYYEGVPVEIRRKALGYLDARLTNTINAFLTRFTDRA